MITNNLNLRETKILNGIQIAFNDFREKLESVDFFVKMKSEIFRAVWYIFKKMVVLILSNLFQVNTKLKVFMMLIAITFIIVFKTDLSKSIKN